MIAKTLAEIASSQTAIPVFACLALVLFVGVFVAMLFWTSRKEAKEIYGAMSAMPMRREGEFHD